MILRLHPLTGRAALSNTHVLHQNHRTAPVSVLGAERKPGAVPQRQERRARVHEPRHDLSRPSATTTMPTLDGGEGGAVKLRGSIVVETLYVHFTSPLANVLMPFSGWFPFGCRVGVHNSQGIKKANTLLPYLDNLAMFHFPQWVRSTHTTPAETETATRSMVNAGRCNCHVYTYRAFTLHTLPATAIVCQLPRSVSSPQKCCCETLIKVVVPPLACGFIAANQSTAGESSRTPTQTQPPPPPYAEKLKKGARCTRRRETTKRSYNTHMYIRHLRTHRHDFMIYSSRLGCVAGWLAGWLT